MLRSSSLVLAVFTACAMLALAGCQRSAHRPPCPAGKVCVEYGNHLEALTLDPQRANLIDEATIISDLMFGLTTDAPDGSPTPAVATSWETSADGLTWTFHLRPVLWSDGVPLTADDFVYAYRRILDPKTGSIYAYLLYVLKNGEAVNGGKAAPESLGVSAPDPHTLVLTLEHPAAYLPELTKHQSFAPVPRHVVEKLGDDWVRPGNYVSDGPFKLVSWRLGDKVTVEKNPRFWDADKVCIDRINYYPTPDAVTAERRVAAGELDINTDFQSNRIGHLRQTIPAYVHTHTSLATAYLTFNTRDVGPLQDVRVRRALSESIDREFIAGKLLRAGEVPAYSFVPAATANFAPGPRVRWAGLSFPERQAEARRLLAAAGHGPAHPLTLQIKSGNATDSLRMVEAIQADWRSIGVQASVAVNEGQVAFAAYRNRDFQVGGRLEWYADFNDPVTFLGLFQSATGAQNYGDYKNPAYDALLDQADHEPDAGKRAGLMAQAEQVMLDGEAIAPIYYVVNRNLVSPKVTGWVDNAENFHRARWLCLKP